ncbi:hypothetical protein GCM10007425_07580 [Lysinibacillus alkalisoli]|uniref:Radical SAM protein n=1 Tax=Lysinibacillus alkalisoli TaxID=1911548 RepID=A0A917FZS1_9BACI|nr:hypothetical protein [Lysinibacillus alkalisoli]GGG15767.1 hypothetical protein GCM10007425_07580 [Lysinibacillus alkalisoli]
MKENILPITQITLSSSQKWLVQFTMCHLKCAWCNKQMTNQQFYTQEKFLKLLQYSNNRSVHFIGGLHKNLEQVMTQLKEENYSLTIETTQMIWRKWLPLMDRIYWHVTTLEQLATIEIWLRFLQHKHIPLTIIFKDPLWYQQYAELPAKYPTIQWH